MRPADEQLALIRRGTAQVEPESELRKKLATGKPLRIKYGIDPTGTSVHLGHTVPLRKMRLFQELGHQAVLIIGNFTALVGDPSGRDQTRAALSRDQIESNARDYLDQIRKVIDVDRAEVHFNGEWFGKYGLTDVLALTSKVTVQRMLERDDFTKRFRAEPSVPIYLHECLYPLMQGQDSVEICADVELGGTEQLFNLMMGRRLQTDAGQEPQVCLTLPILRGLDGTRRMGKSLGNYVGIGESAISQFEKTMSIPDELMREWFELLTDRSAEEIAAALTKPFEAKKTLAADIVTFYHGAEEAVTARAEWERRHSEKKDPTDIPEADIARSALDAEGKVTIVQLLKLAGLVKSGNEAKNLLGPNSGVTIGPDREKVTDPATRIAVTDGLILRVGNRKMARVRLA